MRSFCEGTSLLELAFGKLTGQMEIQRNLSSICETVLSLCLIIKQLLITISREFTFVNYQSHT